MGSPDAPGQGEPPDREPPYRPWPGEQLPYTPSAVAPAGDFSEPAPPPRRRRPWLRAAAVLVAVVGISTGAVLFTQGGGTESTNSVNEDYTYEPPEPPEPSEPEPEPSEPEPEPEPESDQTYIDELTVGDCVDETESFTHVLIVPCDGPHDMQTLANTELEDGFGYPGDDVIEEEASALCNEAYWDAAENWPSEVEEGLDWSKAVPIEETWEVGDRTVVCFVESYYGEALEEDLLSDFFFG
ncbi:septum formation family protein [Streptomyces bicolor]|uniref:septum formation family protein n=1 Tax=Streptomyces bicolor TaxID=66874 RepID=UPI0004E221A1|nr:septum formation family protein [Streptomyces bicolor]